MLQPSDVPALFVVPPKGWGVGILADLPGEPGASALVIVCPDCVAAGVAVAEIKLDKRGGGLRFCAYCPDPHRPSEAHHPNGRAAHTP